MKTSAHATAVCVGLQQKQFIMVIGPVWSPIWSVIIRVINKIGRKRSGRPICLITGMITDPIDDMKSRYQLIIKKKCFFNQSIEINTSQIHPFWNFFSVKAVLIKVSKEIHHKFIHFGKIPSLVGSSDCCRLSWVHLIRLVDVTVRFQVSDYSQLSDFAVRCQPYTIIGGK